MKTNFRLGSVGALLSTVLLYDFSRRARAGRHRFSRFGDDWHA